MLASCWAQNYCFVLITDKPSSKSWNSRPFLKTFAAVFPDSTDRHWVSEDASTKEIKIIFTSAHEHISYSSC